MPLFLTDSYKAKTVLANIAASAESLVVKHYKAARALFSNILEYLLQSSNLALLATNIKA